MDESSAPPLIELAPNHKTGLQLSNPVLVAAGCYGWGNEYRGLVEPELLGAVVVGPVTMGPRRGARPPRAVPFPGGVLLHTGLANPGLLAVLRRSSRVWAQSPVPVILHLAATTPSGVASACQRVSAVEPVAAVELGLRDGVEAEEAAALTAAARSTLRQPLLVRLGLADAAWLAEVVVAAGADGLTVAAPPRGTLPYHGRLVTGRLYGPVVFPLAMHALQQVAGRVKVPLLGCGGVTSADDGLAFLQAGAVAVQVDAALWHNPTSPARIAQTIAAGPVPSGKGSVV